MIRKVRRKEGRRLRHLRIRKRLYGTAERPRLSVYKSLKHLYAQVIDDERGVTLASASSLTPEVRKALEGDVPKTKTDVARQVGKCLARRALARGIKKVAFDRGGFKFHGRVKAFADAAREEGLEF